MPRFRKQMTTSSIHLTKVAAKNIFLWVYFDKFLFHDWPFWRVCALYENFLGSLFSDNVVFYGDSINYHLLVKNIIKCCKNSYCKIYFILLYFTHADYLHIHKLP